MPRITKYHAIYLSLANYLHYTKQCGYPSKVSPAASPRRAVVYDSCLTFGYDKCYQLRSCPHLSQKGLTMKAAVVTGKGTIAVEDVPVPRATEGEVVVRVACCGICGSDVRLLADGFFPVGLIPGHEFSGVISEIGPGVDGWEAGDRVTALPDLTCGRCYYCLHGQQHHCPGLEIVGVSAGLPGAFAEYVKLKATMLHRIPEGVTDREAASVEPCAVSLRAVRLSGIQAGETAIVYGAGAIGLFALQAARLAGARAVYVVEPARNRARAAAALGADGVFDPESNATADIQRLTGVGADVAYVCTAAPPVLQQAVDSVKKMGTVMMVGGGGSATVVPELWMWREVQVRGSFGYLDEFPMALDLFSQKRINIDGMISAAVPLGGIQQAFEDLAQPNSQIKVLVQPD